MRAALLVLSLAAGCVHVTAFDRTTGTVQLCTTSAVVGQSGFDSKANDACAGGAELLRCGSESFVAGTRSSGSAYATAHGNTARGGYNSSTSVVRGVQRCCEYACKSGQLAASAQ